jgi:hypothetical protein
MPQIDAQQLGGTQKHAGLGFARGMIRMDIRSDALWMVGTSKDSIYVRAVTVKASQDDLLNIVKILPGVVATSNAGLVTDNDHWQSSPIRQDNGLSCSWQKCDVFDSMKILNLFDNYAISIQEQRGAFGFSTALIEYLTPNIVWVEKAVSWRRRSHA